METPGSSLLSLEIRRIPGNWPTRSIYSKLSPILNTCECMDTFILTLGNCWEPEVGGACDPTEMRGNLSSGDPSLCSKISGIKRPQFSGKCEHRVALSQAGGPAEVQRSCRGLGGPRWPLANTKMEDHHVMNIDQRRIPLTKNNWI